MTKKIKQSLLLNNFSTTKKIIFCFLIVLLIVILNFSAIRETARDILPSNFKIYVKNIFFGKKYMNEINIFRVQNYNQKVLPETQFNKIQLQKFLIDEFKLTNKINYNKLQKAGLLVKKFFIENNKEDLIAISSLGKIISYKNYNLNDKSILKSNLENYKLFSVLDAKTIADEIFLSISSDYDLEKKCSYFKIIKSKLDKKNLNFQDFYISKKCNLHVQGGRIASYFFKGKKGILVTTGAIEGEKALSQDDKSKLGKVIFFDMKGNSEIISKGHRNPQGLIVLEDNTILETEHGPYGGDEINKIIYNKNYGWPIASYGEPYTYKKKFKLKTFENEKYTHKKNHKELGFEEPIFSFVPSVGISEIIKIPNNFSKLWVGNFLVSSLNGRSLFRIKFDDDYSKILFIEKIYIGERIRDLHIGPNGKKIYLALESTGSIGEISLNKNLN